MNKEDLIKLRMSIIILSAGVLIFILMLVSVLPQIKKIPETNSEITTQQQTLDDDNRKLQDLQNAEKKVESTEDKMLKAFFKPSDSGLDAEAALGLEFSELLQSMRANKIKTQSIQYEYNPMDDNFVKNAPTKYQACRISLKMIANYNDFQNFLRDLYKHPHFLEISKIEVAPYMKNKRILLINLQIKIYALKDSNSPTDAAESSPAAVSQPVAPAAPAAQPVAQPSPSAAPSAASSSQTQSGGPTVVGTEKPIQTPANPTSIHIK